MTDKTKIIYKKHKKNAELCKKAKKSLTSSAPMFSDICSNNADAILIAQNGAPRFILEKLLGNGGMCEVYSALDLYRMQCGDPCPQVAIKKLLPEIANNPHARLSLAQEFFKLRHIAMPSVVRVFDLHQHEGCLCISMELLEGKSLAEELASYPCGMGASGIDIAGMLFEVLANIHRQGVIHADIKPGNIFLEPEGRVVLLDFNVALCIANNGEASSPMGRSTCEEMCLPAYSPCYASPQLLGGATPTTGEDIFGMCITVYELLRGEHPFKRLGSLEAMKKEMLPLKLPFLSLKQWDALRRGLNFEPAARPNAEELREAFSSYGYFDKLKHFVCNKFQNRPAS